MPRKAVAALALILVVAACGQSESATSTTPPVASSSTTTLASTTTTTTTTTLPETTTTTSVAGQAVQVVFGSQDQSDCSNVVAVERTVDREADPIEAAFQLLVGGPTAEEQAQGAISFFSAETAGMVSSVTLENGLLTVDFDDLRPVLNNASTTCGSFSLLAQLNGTAFGFDDVERVTYQIEGSCDAFFGWLQRECREYSRP